VFLPGTGAGESGLRAPASFASTGNFGRQNNTNLVGLAGLLGGFGYGVVAAFLTSRLLHFPLLLASRRRRWTALATPAASG
jgi:hypothetical protein